VKPIFFGQWGITKKREGVLLYLGMKDDPLGIIFWLEMQSHFRGEEKKTKYHCYL
jgi:hypothetical protein